MPLALLINPDGRPIPRHSGSGANETPRSAFVGSCEETIMEDQRPTIPHQLSSSQVLWRFVLRLLLLSTFATFSTQGFGTTFAALLTLSATFCAVLGAMRREAMFGPVLTHWDEAAAYAVIGRLVSAIF
jgi:hypothetical protein